MTDSYSDDWVPPPPPPVAPPTSPSFSAGGFPQSPAPAMSAPMSGPAMVAAKVDGDFGRAAIFGLAAAALGGLAWYLVVAFTQRQFVILALGVGFLIGVGTLKGARRPGPSIAILAGVIAVLAMFFAHYFIDRHFLVKAIESRGAVASVPLWMGFHDAWTLVRLVATDEPSQYLFSLLAIGAAAFTGFKGR
jgi:hypothetical protein